MDRTSGYTLVELLVVLAIVGLLAAFAIPNIRGTVERAELRSDTAKLVQQLRALKQRSIQSQAPIRLLPDKSGSNILVIPGPQLELHGREKLVSAQKPDIIFFPDGTTSGGRIDLLEEDAAISVEIAWLTGTIDVRALK